MARHSSPSPGPDASTLERGRATSSAGGGRRPGQPHRIAGRARRRGCCAATSRTRSPEGASTSISAGATPVISAAMPVTDANTSAGTSDGDVWSRPTDDVSRRRRRRNVARRADCLLNPLRRRASPDVVSRRRARAVNVRPALVSIASRPSSSRNAAAIRSSTFMPPCCQSGHYQASVRSVPAATAFAIRRERVQKPLAAA